MSVSEASRQFLKITDGPSGSLNCQKVTGISEISSKSNVRTHTQAPWPGRENASDSIKICDVVWQPVDTLTRDPELFLDLQSPMICCCYVMVST